MSLTRLLDQQHTRLSDLLGLLQQEQECLVQGQVDTEALVGLATRKSEIQQQLAETEARRRQVQCRLGYADDREGARQAAMDAGCIAQWDSTMAMARDVSRANLRCGELLGLRMQHNQQMLDEIHRIANASVYRPDGRTRLQPSRLNVSA
ncbi:MULTISPECIES: flagella synthesis protein FlgN [Halomonas]|uniref:flagella synthesis protein FlgN n=1 Tax=Halomonas TaxID=2745 RepID=UPI001C93FB11|nr:MULTISPECIES: flagellar protein FlgN [Halomonas]MED5295258.1 flagellar protein FlgN [Pseudomonadota bacterium]MBY5924920.1 flagellar protein FlgN [Halomonas sp. DP4Y7-2]MBY6206178.1 flagellar protein FlgN [Halomonas sp. DP3Y7-2]MBY6227931.1 flagellar protein FlgN [Halomonas sp. DP3Y7-1]MBY6231961.1 flagellar protein FlgN [Halomonas sp. DP4Y7-1]